ncbi:MAG: alpha-hydroxy acid oxidase [Faecalibacterium sp.]
MDFSQVKTPGNTNEITRAYLDNLLIESRYIDSVVPDTSMQLYGKTFASPIMIAAFSHLGGWYPNGMVEMANAAKNAGICNWAGMGDEAELGEVLATGAATIKIVKPYADRSWIYNRLQHAYQNGALAVGIDIDHSFNKAGQQDVVNGLVMNPLTLQELRDFVQATPLPFVVKGVLSVSDALKCKEAGVKGILVSHHHGIAPCGVPPLMILPKIRAAVGDDMDIFVDCSIDNGMDAFKALALGADAVCVGRAVLEPFKKTGAAGAEEYLKTMHDQLRSTMARTGATCLADISPDVIWNT